MTADLRAVVFDWDGTLVDSAAASFRCYEQIFSSFGLRFGREDFARTYSPDWTHTYRMLRLPEERWPEADRLWLELYARQPSTLFPGARPTLNALAERGFSLGLVTSGDRARVTSELRELGLDAVFATVVCGGDVSPKKPHPAALLSALDSLGVPARESVYVGDSPEDIEMARAAGARSIGIPGGFPNRDALVASRPDWLLTELEAVIEALGPGPVVR